MRWGELIVVRETMLDLYETILGFYETILGFYETIYDLVYIYSQLFSLVP